MSKFLYAEINAVGIVLLLLLLNNLRSGARDVPLDQRIFNSIILANILIFLFDTGMWLLDGNPGPGMRIANYLATALYYVFNPLICFLWLLYTDLKIHESRSGLRKRARFYAIPAVISGLMSLASPFTGWFFIIDEANRYARGPLFAVMAAAAFFYLALACAISLYDIHKNGWEGNKSVNLHLVLFPIGLLLASTVQIMFFGISVIWVCAMLAIASIYINIQNKEISTDHLTGVYNRRRLDQYLQRRIQAKRGDRLLFAIALDLDDFKSINDRYGHAAGDSALVHTASLLRQACRGSDDFIARMGGDEFIVVGERAEEGGIRQLMEQIGALSLAHNHSHPADGPLLLSLGYSVFSRGDTLESFLAAADAQMYRNKEERKRRQQEARPPAGLASPTPGA